MSIHAPLLHAVPASGAAHRRPCPASGPAPCRVGNWPDPMRQLSRDTRETRTPVS
jgi:hypothetical protein